MNASRSDVDRAWWKEAVVYQIYPRSFNDSDGDGIGDLPGITERVDYLAELGVDVVWLNPVYESPMADMGYDIADYRAIHPAFGTMADWEELRDELHDRGIRLIMDLVVNHTSDEHGWFRRSRAGEEPYDDYYVWRPGEPDEPPNNWEAFFGGSAWTYDEARGEWYLGLFTPEQPDLNWENPQVREEVHDVVRFWLGKGIDGFRMDVINLVSKAEGLPDGDPESPLVGAEHFVDGPRIHEYMNELSTEGFGEREIMVVGECVGVDPETALDYCGRKSDAMDMCIAFELMDVDRGDSRWEPTGWSLADLREVLVDWQETLGEEGWNCLYLNNHDQPRAVSRFGDDGEYRRESATMLATLLHGHRGTPFVYQGEEIGMTNAPFETPETLRDVEAINFVERRLEAGASFEELRPLLSAQSRDNARTPMQWSDAEHAGFTDGEPWIGVNPNYEEVNVDREREADRSVFRYYRALIELRHRSETLVYGDFEPLLPGHEEVYAIRRTLDDDRLVVVCNAFDGTPTVSLPDRTDGADADLLLCNYGEGEPRLEDLSLRPYEARIYRVGETE